MCSGKGSVGSPESQLGRERELKKASRSFRTISVEHKTQGNKQTYQEMASVKQGSHDRTA